MRLVVFGSPDVVLELHSEVTVVRGLREQHTRSIALRIGPLAREPLELARLNASG